MGKSRTLKIVVLLIAVLVVLPVFSYLVSFTLNHHGEPEIVEGNNLILILPFKPGDTITLQYVLTGSNGNQTVIIDNRTITLRIEEIGFPYINTSGGPIPVELIHPILASSDPLNPHILYYSYYLNDWSCLKLSPTAQNGEYDAFPKSGCTRFLGSVIVDKNGILQRAKLVVPTGNGLLMEYLYVVTYTSSGTTTIHYNPEDYLCFGSESINILYTAPGGYIIRNHKLLYVGKVNVTESHVGIILAKDSVGAMVWYNITTGAVKVPENTTILVVSPLFPVPSNETNTLYVDGKPVARGIDILSWLKEHYG